MLLCLFYEIYQSPVPIKKVLFSNTHILLELHLYEQLGFRFWTCDQSTSYFTQKKKYMFGLCNFF